MRTSTAQPKDYLDAFFDTGIERTRRDSAEPPRQPTTSRPTDIPGHQARSGPYPHAR